MDAVPKMSGGGAGGVGGRKRARDYMKYQHQETMQKVEVYSGTAAFEGTYELLKLLDGQLATPLSKPFASYITTKATLKELETIKSIVDTGTSMGGTESKVHKMAPVMLAHYTNMENMMTGAKLFIDAMKETLYQLYLKEFAMGERADNKAFLAIVDQEIAVLRATGGIHSTASASAAGQGDTSMG